MSACRPSANFMRVVDEVVGERHAARAAEAPGLAHRLLEEPAQVRVGAHHAERRARDRSGARQRRPGTRTSPSRARSMSSASSALMPAAWHAARNASALPLRRQHRPELQARHRAGVLDHARRADARGDVGRRRPARASAGSTLLRRVDRLDAVLERDDARASADDRPQLLGGRLRCPRASPRTGRRPPRPTSRGSSSARTLSTRVAVRALDPAGRSRASLRDACRARRSARRGRPAARRAPK